MSRKIFVIGVDYGTDSVRSVIYDTSDGSEIASSVFEFPRWKDRLFCDPKKNTFRQHPLDYVEGLEFTIRELVSKLKGRDVSSIVAMSFDTTASTPVAVNADGIPLSLTRGFEENPNAMFILWKDHSAIREAEEINQLAKSWSGEDFTRYSGGVYSPEWFWAKVLHVLRVDDGVRRNAVSWVEHCDWMPALLTGNTNPLNMKRSRCAAGHKAMWNESYNGLPSEEFLTRLDPLLLGIRGKLYTETHTTEVAAGTLTKEWAERLDLHPGVVIGVGAIDAHMGAVGAEVKPGYMCKVLGTSTCDLLVAPGEAFGETIVHGICGQVDGSIIPGMIGLEAGQSAFGDVYAWFRDLLMWPLEHFSMSEEKDCDSFKERTEENLIRKLSEMAEKVDPEESSVLAVDWFNGRRTPDANPLVKGAITGLTLGSDAPAIFRALVESTAYGSKMIIERFRSEGIEIKGIIAMGGIAKKSPFVMQVLADVLNMPIQVVRAEQACALGSAMAASVVGGVHFSLQDAQIAMGNGIETGYFPDPQNVEIYKKTYTLYGKFNSFINEVSA